MKAGKRRYSGDDSKWFWDRVRQQLQKGIELVESAYSHVSHGGPTMADAEKWLKDAKQALAPDWSPGDVIAAYPDGTIVLDDGITTWNLERAQKFLAASRVAEPRLPEPREWLCSGGGGHEDGEDGIRAMTCSGEGLVDFLESYRDDIAADLRGRVAKGLDWRETQLEDALRALVEQFHAYENGWLGEGVWRIRAGLLADLIRAESLLRAARSIAQGEAK